MTTSEAFEALEKESMGTRLQHIVAQLEALTSDLLALGFQDGYKDAQWILEDVLSLLEIHDAIQASVAGNTPASTAG